MNTFLVWLLISIASPEVKELTGKVVSITDGDTLTVLDDSKVQHKIRLQGIDAPEKSQAFGNVARKTLGDKVHNRQVRVSWKEKDRYGRIIGEMYVDDRHINVEMVEEGVAWWYEKYAPNDRQLQQAEKKAREAKRGLWSDKAPVAPWEFRASKRSTTGQR